MEVGNDAPGKLHREQTAPNDTAFGLLSQGVKRHYKKLQAVRSAPNKAKKPTLLIQPMTLETYATRFMIALTGAASVWLFFPML
jgi:hypothetical protein